MRSLTAKDFDSCAAALAKVTRPLFQPMSSSNFQPVLDSDTGHLLAHLRLGIADRSFATFLTHIVEMMTLGCPVNCTNVTSFLSNILAQLNTTRSTDREFLQAVLRQRPLFRHLCSLLKYFRLLELPWYSALGRPVLADILNNIIFPCAVHIWEGFREESGSFLQLLCSADIFGALEAIILQFGSLREAGAGRSSSPPMI